MVCRENVQYADECEVKYGRGFIILLNRYAVRFRVSMSLEIKILVVVKRIRIETDLQTRASQTPSDHRNPLHPFAAPRD